MLARRAFASKHFENVDPFARFACACGSRGNREEICQADEVSSLGCRGQRGWPTEQQRNATGRLKEILFLPAVMVAEKIAMIGKETDENVVRVGSRFDRIENSPETIIEICDLAVVTGLHDFTQRGVNCICPNGATHERNFFIQMIFLDLAENWFRHSIGIVHPVERNRRSQRRMRSNE